MSVVILLAVRDPGQRVGLGDWASEGPRRPTYMYMCTCVYICIYMYIHIYIWREREM